ncbi:MAG TPA: TrkA family potassium uptake protein [Clostridiales bacterium]|nr:TrkA family potassium uptake protein [Clostridiales bacterium]
MFRQKSVIEFGIIGLGRFGRALTKTLSALGKDLIAVDTLESRVKLAKYDAENIFLVGDYERESLEDVGIQNCETVIVCIGDSIDVGVLTALNVVGMEIPRVIARAMSAEQGLILEKIGAEVIYPENDMAVRLAKKLANTSIMETIELRGSIEITELKLTPKFAGMSVAEVNLRQRFNINIIALEQKGETTTEVSPDYVFQEGDNIVVIGQKNNIKKLEEYLTK